MSEREKAENRRNATDNAEFWDSVQECRDLLAPLITRAGRYLARLTEIEVRVADRARFWIEDPWFEKWFGKRSREVLEARNAKVSQSYREFFDFTEEVLAAFEKLRALLPLAEVEGLTRQVNGNKKDTYDAILRAAEKVDEFWLHR